MNSLIKFRAEQDMTQAKAALFFRVSESSIRRYEKGGPVRRTIAERIKLISNGAVILLTDEDDE